MESPLRIESFEGLGRAKQEIIGQTEVGRFEASGMLTSEQVAAYLRTELPLSHLDGCPSIFYEPTAPQFSNSSTLAFFTIASHEIKIGPVERFEDAEDMLGTIVHEVGHNVHENIINQHPDLAAAWEHIHGGKFAEIFGDGFVSDYARTNQYEDFAETYRVYVRDPELLQVINPEKYNFMYNYVFGGREYPQ
ncbi:MAG: hypothetical protein OHK0022_36950 [Roseiflexaceae bacterium]